MPGPITVHGSFLTQPTLAVPTGRLQLEVHGGTPDLTQLFIDIPGVTLGTVSMTPYAINYVFDQAGIAPGAYTATITDSYTPTTRLTFAFTILLPPVLGCTDPSADNYDPSATQDDGSCTYTPAPRIPYFFVPPHQSLRFVHPDRADLPAYDNRLLAEAAPVDTTNPGYSQLVEKADTLVLQFQSNYDNLTNQTGPFVNVRESASSNTVLAPTPTRVVQGVGVTPEFDAYARPDTLASRTRVYFNSESLPVPFQPGQRVTLIGAGVLSGTYPINNVLEDPAAAIPYLLLTTPYPGGSQRIDLTLTTPYALQVFDTWQVVIPFSSVPVGCYYVTIGVRDTEFDQTEAVSEPIDVRVSHPDTVRVVWRNFDNAYGLNYTNGLINRLRVKGRFFERESPSQKTTLRSSNNRLTLLSSDVQRKIPLTVQLAPGYLHETIAIATAHDYLRINDVEVVVEDEYKYPTVSRYTLGTGSVLAEQVDFLTGNRDDVGDVDGGPYLIVDNVYLEINP